MNPVRAGMVPSPGEYTWSSYFANATGEPYGGLKPHPAYEGLGTIADQRASAYRQMFEAELPVAFVEEIRKATRLGCVIGARRRRKGRPSG
jgi:putative transposase